MSVLERVRTGTAFRLRGGPLAGAAAVSAVLDTATTWHVLTSPTAVEANVVIQGLKAVHVGLAIAAFAGFAGFLLAVTVLDLGWVSTVAGTYLVVSMGVAGTSNLVGFFTGTFPLAVAFSDVSAAIAYGFPIAGLLAGTAIHYRLAGELPWREVVAGWLIAVAVAVTLPAVLG